MNYLQLLKAAQLACTREEAQRILNEAKRLQLLDNTYKEHFMFLATK